MTGRRRIFDAAHHLSVRRNALRRAASLHLSSLRPATHLISSPLNATSFRGEQPTVDRAPRLIESQCNAALRITPLCYTASRPASPRFAPQRNVFSMTDLLHQLGATPRDALVFLAGAALAFGLNALWWWRHEVRKARRARLERFRRDFGG